MAATLDNSLRSLLLAWHWRPEVAAVLLGLGGAYLSGWRRLRRRGHARLTPVWRLCAYLGGLASLALALLSPIDRLAHLSFTGHMIQHQLLLMAAPPLLLLGNPFPVVMWALPRRLRRRTGRLLSRGSPLQRVFRLLTWMPVAGLLYAGNLWAWHIPAAYEAALHDHLVHDLEHVAFFGTAVLFWWPVVNPAPRLHRWRGGLYYGFRIAYLVLATAQNTLLGAVIGLTERLLYPSYATPRLFGLSALDDQALGGGIMWSGGHMYLVAILILVARAMNSERGADAALRGERLPP